jgi:hypothetical protein
VNAEQHARFRAFRIRAYALLLAAVMMELAVPLSIEGFSTQSTGTNGSSGANLPPENVTPENVTSPSSCGATCGLAFGVVILWNGLGAALGLLGYSALLLADAVQLEAGERPWSALRALGRALERGGRWLSGRRP